MQLRHLMMYRSGFAIEFVADDQLRFVRCHRRGDARQDPLTITDLGVSDVQSQLVRMQTCLDYP